MYYKLKQFVDIQNRLVKSGFAKENDFTYSGDLGYKELKCYPTNKALGSFISFRWYDRNGSFGLCFGYDNTLGAWGDFKYHADVTDIIDTIGVDTTWIGKVVAMATEKYPNYIIR